MHAHTVGKSFIREELRAVTLLTAVTWVMQLGNPTWSFFKLLCIKAFCLYAFSNCRRSVLTRNIQMMNLWRRPTPTEQLQGMDGTCSSQQGVPLTVYLAGSSKDKGTDTAREQQVIGVPLYRRALTASLVAHAVSVQP